VNSWLQNAYQYARRWGLDHETAYLYTYLVYIGRRNGRPIPAITSGYRSPAHNAALQTRWDLGDRSGLIQRPSSTSKHLQARAFDLTGLSRDDLLWYGQLNRLFPGVSWGGKWTHRDPNHWQLDRERGAYGV